MSRQSEIRRLEDLVAAVRGGRSSSLFIVGPAGIGKSWLCRRACALADGFTVVGTRGMASETHLDHGGLFDVLSPLLPGRLDRLLTARADALRGALRMTEPLVADPFAVAVATLDLLTMAAQDAPVLVVVDDAPWVDAASLEALRFAARRLDADRVGVLFAARSDSAAPLIATGFESLTVAGLNPEEELVGATVKEVRARRRTAAGDPSWLREAASEPLAADTAPDADEALQPCLERARDLAHAGRTSEALNELDVILARGGIADLRADVETLHGQLLISKGCIEQAARVLEAGAARIRERDGARAAVMLCGAAFAKASRGEMSAAIATAEGAVALAGPPGGASEAAAKSTLGTVLIAAGEGARGYPLLLRYADLGDPSGRAPDGWSGPARLGLFACWMEDYNTARCALERAVTLARDRGLVSNLPLALSAFAELEFRVGHWISARAHAEEALQLAEDTDQFLHFGHTVLLQLDAVTGDADGARAYADIVSAVAERSGSRALELHADAGRGLLELGLDRPEAAIVHLTRTRELAERFGLREPNYVQWMPNLIESQIRAGEGHDGLSTLAAFESEAQRTGRRWALATAARCRGLLAPPETADAVFEEAHRLVAALPSPFERARTELCWGERLRRDGRRIEARRHLHDAHQRFEALGANPWAEKAARELRSSGGRARRGARARSDQLTAQQVQIATMVAEGRTNKSVANSLFLSPRTIEAHLSHVYRKLDVHNRTELARALQLTSTPPS